MCGEALPQLVWHAYLIVYKTNRHRINGAGLFHGLADDIHNWLAATATVVVANIAAVIVAEEQQNDNKQNPSAASVAKHIT